MDQVSYIVQQMIEATSLVAVLSATPIYIHDDMRSRFSKISV